MIGAERIVMGSVVCLGVAVAGHNFFYAWEAVWTVLGITGLILGGAGVILWVVWNGVRGER